MSKTTALDCRLTGNVCLTTDNLEKLAKGEGGGLPPNGQHAHTSNGMRGTFNITSPASHQTAASNVPKETQVSLSGPED